ncbi:hypothetical protein TGME49_297690 [Toxoplasma gondii ME49]|uniref:Uncharacterized protein n=1 Tax=Toxoplasma gondii (strain ATCC 50611 / Me49) TaxID=508771 RepID=S8GJZ2_TOXGM|nr:hypothetical protein TGME49_297690 [Toxoplasma gondii ME49]EPT32185.1 hypothetical protein TGME49_297690 [Toxoplasma gondii ME49]|eukprot:XP_002371189.1 hypothetical protein TGME49_297690 [Toxoplasma gondii ME49]
MADPPLHLSARAQVPLRPQVLSDAVRPSAVSPKVAGPPTGNPSAHGFQGIDASPVPGAPLRNSSSNSLGGGTLSHGVSMSKSGLSVALAGVQSRSDVPFVPPPQLISSSGAPESGENNGRALREPLLSPSAACGAADAQVGQQATPPACRLADPARNAGTPQIVGKAPPFRPQKSPGAPVQNGLQIRPNPEAQERTGLAENSPADGVGSRLSASSSATLPTGRLHAARSTFASTGGSHPGSGNQEAPEPIQVPVASHISSNSPFPMAAAPSLDALSSPEKLSLPSTLNRISSTAPASSLGRPQAAQPLLGGVRVPDGQGRSGGPLPVQPVSSSALAAASAPSRSHAVSIRGPFSLNCSPTSAPPATSGPPRALAGLHASNVFTGTAVAGAGCAPSHQFQARAPVPARLPVSAGSSAPATISSSSAVASTAPSGSRPVGVLSADAAKTPNPVTSAVVNHSASGGAALPRFTSPFASIPARSLSAAGPPGDSPGAPSASVSPSATAVVAAKRRVLPPGGQPGATAASPVSRVSAASRLANFASLGAQTTLPTALNCAATAGAAAGGGAGSGAGGGGPGVPGPSASCPVRYGSLGSSAAAGVQTPRGSQGPARLSRGQAGGPTLTHASGRPSPAAKAQCSRSECSSPHALLSSTPSPPGSPSLRLHPRPGVCTAGKGRQRSTSVGSAHSSAAVLAAAASRLAHLSGKAPSPTAGLGPSRVPSSPSNAGLDPLLSPGGAGGSPLAVGGSPLFGRGLGAQPTDAASRAAAVVAAAAAAAAAGYSSLAAATSSGLSSCAVLKSSKSANAPSPRARSQQSADSPSASGAKRLASGRAGASTPGRRSISQETPREVLSGDGALKPGPDAEACKEKETQSPSKEKDGEADTPAGGRQGSSVASAGAPEKLDKSEDDAEAARLQILASLFPRAETPVTSGSKTPGPASGSLEPIAADGAPAHAARQSASEEADDDHLRDFWSQELEISKVPQYLDDNPRGEGWLVVASPLPACVARQDLLREKVRAHLAPQLEAATGQKQGPPPGFRDCLSTATRNPFPAGTGRTCVDNDGRRLSDTASAHQALLSNVLSSRPSSPKDASALAPSRQLSPEERGDSQRPVCGEEGPGASGAQGAQRETDGTSGDGHAPPLKRRRTDEDCATAVGNGALTPPDDLLHVLPRLSSVERRRMRQLEQPVLSKERRQKVTQHLCASARNLLQCVQEMQLLGALPRAIAAAPEAPPNGLTDCRSAALDELRKAMLDLPPSALWSGLHAPGPFSSSRRQASSLSPAERLGTDGGDEAATAEEEDSERPDIFFHLAKDSDQESPAPPGGVGSGLWASPGGAGSETFSGRGSASAVSGVAPAPHRETSFSPSPIDAEAFWFGDEDSLVWSESEEEGDAVEAFPFGPGDPYSVLYSGSHEVSASRHPLADLAGALAASEVAARPAQGASDDAYGPKLGASFPSFSAPRTLREAFQEARATLPWRVPPHLNEEEAAAWLREALREQKKRETEFRNLRLFQLERKAVGAQLSLCSPRHLPAGQEVFAIERPGDGLRFLPLTAEEEDELHLLREQRRRDWENVEKAKQQLRAVMCEKDVKAQRHIQARLQRLSERLVNRERRRAEDFRRLRELREQELKWCEERKIQAAQEEREREALKVEDATAAERERADRVSREREGEREKTGEGALHVHFRGEDRRPSRLGAAKSTAVSESEELPRSSSELPSDAPNSRPFPVSSTSLLQRQSAEVPTGGTQAAPSGLSAPQGLAGAADGASIPAPAETSNLLEKSSTETAVSSFSLSREISTPEANGKALEVTPCLKLARSAPVLGQPATPQGGASEAGDRRSYFLASSKTEANGGRASPSEGENGDDKAPRDSGGPACNFSEARDNPGDPNVLSQPSKLNVNPILIADRQTANSIRSGRGGEVPAGGTEESVVKATRGGETTQEGKENQELKMVEVSAGASPAPLSVGGNQADLRPRGEGGKDECELSVSPNEGPRGGTGRDQDATSTLHAESQGQGCGVPLAHALQRAPESSMFQPFEQLQPSQLQQLLQFQQTQRLEVPAPGAQGTHSLEAAPARLREDPLPPQLRSVQHQHSLVQLPAHGVQQPHLQALLQKQQLLRQQILQNALAQQQRQNRPR